VAKKTVTKPAAVTKPVAKDVAGSKSARTRERILDAAAKVLSSKGYAGTRLADVAEEAEIQAPAIYYYYPSREDLIEAVMYAGIAHMREHVEKSLDELPADSTALDRIEAAVGAHLRYELEVSDYTTAAVRNQGQVPAELRTRYDTESAKYGELWRGLIGAAKADKTLRKDIDPSLAMMLILGALNWTTEWWDSSRGSIDDVVATAQSLVRNGIARP
jgi:AcrR family transcriptional regulator